MFSCDKALIVACSSTGPGLILKRLTKQDSQQDTYGVPINLALGVLELRKVPAAICCPPVVPEAAIDNLHEGARSRALQHLLCLLASILQFTDKESEKHKSGSITRQHNGVRRGCPATDRGAHLASCCCTGQGATALQRRELFLLHETREKIRINSSTQCALTGGTILQQYLRVRYAKRTFCSATATFSARTRSLCARREALQHHQRISTVLRFFTIATTDVETTSTCWPWGRSALQRRA